MNLHGMKSIFCIHEFLRLADTKKEVGEEDLHELAKNDGKRLENS